MARNLILTGGLYHPFEEASETLAALLQDVDIQSDITTDIQKHGVVVRINSAGPLPSIQGDQVQLRQVFLKY